MANILTLILFAVVLITVFRIGQAVAHSERLRPELGSKILITFVLLPSVLQLVIPRIFNWFVAKPDLVLHHHEYWRLLTAIAVQDGGVLSLILNLILLFMVVVAADQIWNWRYELAIFGILGIALNLSGVLFNVTTAGNSGATLALAGSSIGAYLATKQPRNQNLFLAVVSMAAGFMLAVLHNPHGYAVIAGAIVGYLLGQHQSVRQHTRA